jgi:conjugative relaxase-like TrwC/TraI family protein
MLTISKPISASQARTYHKQEFASQQQNYWSRDQQGHSEWQGRLADQWKLSGRVESEHFARLSEGQHPLSEEQLVRHQVSRTYDGKFGKEVTSTEHRAGWDATFSAPKSVSLTSLVGGDDRVREAHRQSVRVALQELERYTQARIGNVHAPETTGKFIAATFEHDTARPVNGYAAPQLHTHAVIFNVTEQENGQTRSIQPHEMFVSQCYATAIYRSELALHLEKLGYELERGKHGQPEIRGYSKEYLEASSPRREQIKDHLREQGIDGAAAAQIAAHHTRDRKKLLSQQEVLQRHRDLAAQYGHQADGVVALAHDQGQFKKRDPEMHARMAVTWARDQVFERSAVNDLRAILEPALARGMGETSYTGVRAEFERRIDAGEFQEVLHAGTHPKYTTNSMMQMEREIISRMQEGNRRDYGDPCRIAREWSGQARGTFHSNARSTPGPHRG